MELFENEIGFKLFCNKNIEIMIEFQMKFDIVKVVIVAKLMNWIAKFK